MRGWCLGRLALLFLVAAAPPPALSITAMPPEAQPGTAVRASVALHADGQTMRSYDVQIMADGLQIVEASSASGICSAPPQSPRSPPVAPRMRGVGGEGVTCQVLAGAGAPAALFVTTVALPSCDGQARLEAVSGSARAARRITIGGPRRCTLWAPLVVRD